MKANNTLAQTANKKQTFSTFITSKPIQNRIYEMVASPREGAQFMSAIISAVTNNPALQGCSHMSILNCALLGLSLKLSPSPQLGQYYMVPFEDKKQGLLAQFILGYKGYVQLALRSGQYRKLNVLPIKAGELIRYDPLEEAIEVKLIENEEERANTETIGYYAFFEYLNGFRKTLYWSRAKMESHAKLYSKGYAKDLEKGTSYTFWSKDFDAMACKTMLRQLISKWGVTSVDLQSAMETALNADTKALSDDNTLIDTSSTPELTSAPGTAQLTQNTAQDVPEQTQAPADFQNAFFDD